MSLYDVIGWDYVGAFGYPDLPNIGMRVEEGLNPSDSVMRIDSYGWTTENGSNEWVLQTDFGKSLSQEYLWPDSVLIDINITNIESNVWFLGMLISLDDTTEGEGSTTYLSHSIPIVSGWQTIHFWAGSGILNGREKLIHGIGIHINPSSIDSGYVGIELQFNDMRLKYDDGSITLIEPFQVYWPTDVEPIPNLVPNGFILSQNYPNPFNPSTTIKFSIEQQSEVDLTVFNSLGQEVKTLILSRDMNAGTHEVSFDGSDLPSGVYFYKLQVGSYVETKKMILMK